MNLDFKENYILENDWVRLQPIVVSDFDHLPEFSENEQKIWKYNSEGANGIENLEKSI